MSDAMREANEKAKREAEQAKLKGITPFDDVSGNDVKKEVKQDELEKYYSREVKIPKKQVSIYLDEDVIEAFNEWGKVEGKGAKSDLVNNFLMNTLGVKRNNQG